MSQMSPLDGIFLSLETPETPAHIGGLAVLVSLIYLIFELRRNTRTARSGAAWDATVGLAELCEEIAGSQELAEICMRALEPDADSEEFTSGELARFFFVCRSVLYKYEGQWYLWKDGWLENALRPDHPHTSSLEIKSAGQDRSR